MILTIELAIPDGPGGPPTGTVIDAAGERAAFSGWTGLLAVLYDLGQSVRSHDAPPSSAG